MAKKNKRAKKEESSMANAISDMVIKEVKKAVVSAVRSTIRTAISGAIVHYTAKGAHAAQVYVQNARAKKALKQHDTPVHRLTSEQTVPVKEPTPPGCVGEGTPPSEGGKLPE